MRKKVVLGVLGISLLLTSCGGNKGKLGNSVDLSATPYATDVNKATPKAKMNECKMSVDEMRTAVGNTTSQLGDGDSLLISTYLNGVSENSLVNSIGYSNNFRFTYKSNTYTGLQCFGDADTKIVYFNNLVTGELNKDSDKVCYESLFGDGGDVVDLFDGAYEFKKGGVGDFLGTECYYMTVSYDSSIEVAIASASGISSKVTKQFYFDKTGKFVGIKYVQSEDYVFYTVVDSGAEMSVPNNYRDASEYCLKDYSKAYDKAYTKAVEDTLNSTDSSTNSKKSKK